MEDEAMQKTEQRTRNASALVLAAGAGSRLGLGPKAFLLLGKRTFFDRILDVLLECVDRIIVGVHPTDLDRAYEEAKNRAEVFAGGTTREKTLHLLFNRCEEDIVLVHSVARPFVDRNLVMTVLSAAKDFGAATSFAPQNVPGIILEGDFIQKTICRSRVGLFQTPHAFRRPVLEQALQYALDHNIEAFEPIELLSRLGVPVRAVPDKGHNIKITTPLDWEIAKRILMPALSNLTNHPIKHSRHKSL